MSTEETEILHKIANGDASQFKYLYKTYYKSLCSYVYNHFNDVAEAENVVQEVFTQLWEQRARLKKVKNLKSYLFQATHFKCLDLLRSKKVQQKFEDEVSYKLKEIEFEDELVSEENLSQIENAINDLPEQRKKVVVMKRLQGLSYKHISEKLGISERTAETHMSLAMKSLRAKLSHFLTIAVIFLVKIGFDITGF